jgi:hypothetical protein
MLHNYFSQLHFKNSLSQLKLYLKHCKHEKEELVEKNQDEPEEEFVLSAPPGHS